MMFPLMFALTVVSSAAVAAGLLIVTGRLAGKGPEPVRVLALSARVVPARRPVR